MPHESRGASLPFPLPVGLHTLSKSPPTQFLKICIFQTEENMELSFLSLFYFNGFYFIRNIVQLIELCAWKKIQVSCDPKVHKCLGGQKLMHRFLSIENLVWNEGYELMVDPCTADPDPGFSRSRSWV